MSAEASPPSPRIHVDLEYLVRLQFDAGHFSFLPRQPVHSLLSGGHASRLRGRGLAFEELRPYRAGDDIRSMDWKATARLRKPHIRVYSEERERPVLFLVDQRTSMFFGSARATKAVAAAELAALGCWRTLDAGDRVGAVIFGDDEVVHIAPQRSRGTVLRICHEMARLNQTLHADRPGENPGGLNDAIRRAVNLAPHDVLVVLVSDCDGADSETRELVTKLAVHNDVLAALVYDPMGFRLPKSPGLRVSDGRKQFPLPGGARFEQEYEKIFIEWSTKLRDRFKALRIPMLPICTHEPVVDQVLRALGHRP